MATRKISLFFCTLLFLAVAAIAGRAQTVEPLTTEQLAQTGGGLIEVLDQIKQAQSQQFEGSWAVTVTPVVPPGVPQPASFRAHGTVSRGGAFFGSDRTRPFSKQHGAWVHLGGNDFAYTVVEDLFDALGAFAGTITVRVKLTVTGKDTFIGVSNGESRDAAGNLVFNRCATVRGERIKVEPLSAQCQSITPPQ